MYKAIRPYFYLLSAVVVSATLYCYNPFNLYFLADDFLHIPASAINLWVQQNSLRPLGNLSLHIDYWFSSTHAIGYHFSNLLLHLFNTILVFAISKELFKNFNSTNLVIAPLLIAVFFFSYPFHSEAVFWIIGRSGSLSTLFLLAALYCWFKKNGTIYYSAGVFIFFQLALFTYESAWTFPLILLLLIYLDWRDFLKQRAKNIAIVFVVFVQFIAYLYLRFYTTGELMTHYDAGAFLQFDFSKLTQNFLRLLARTFVPPFFSNQYFILVFAVLVVVVSILKFSMYRKQKIDRFFIAIAFIWMISYLPYLSIGIDTHGVEGERYLYMPSVFFCIWIIYVLLQLYSLKTVMIIFTLMVSANIFYLNQSRNYYQKAGLIVKTTLHELDKLENRKRIFFVGLPQYNKGAVVWRTGLTDAVNWLAKNKQQEIIVVSKDNSDELPKQNHYTNFKVLYSYQQEQQSFNSVLIPDKTFKTNYIQKDTFGLVFNSTTDAVFSYTDTSLTVIR